MVPFRDQVDLEINRKEAQQKRAPTTAEKATNWWAAMGIIFLCLVGIIRGQAYLLSQIKYLQTEWLKWILIIAAVGFGLIVFVLICKWIWLRRNINQFEELFKEQKKNE